MEKEEQYVAPQIEVIELDTEGIIATSNTVESSKIGIFQRSSFV